MNWREINENVLKSAILVTMMALSSVANGQTTWTGAGGDDNWFTAGNWDTGIVPNGSSFDAIVDSPSPTDISSGIVNLNSLFVGPGGMVIVTNRDLRFDGTASTTLTNQGVISTSGNTTHDLQLVRDVINSNLIVVNGADLEVTGIDGATLSGGGTVTLQAGRISGAGATFLDLTVEDQRIEGEGSIQSTTGLIIDAGSTVDANVSDATLSIGTANNSFVNAGTLQASNAGSLFLTGVGNNDNTLDNTSGTIQALAGSDVAFSNININGGLLMTEGDGVLRASVGGGQSYQDVTIDGNFVIENTNLNARFAGTIENRQTITLNSTGSAVNFDIPGGQTTTMTGGGTIQLLATVDPGFAAINRDGGSGPAAMILDDQTIEGNGLIANNFVMTNTAGNLIDANVDGEVLIISTGGSGNGLDGHVNRGTVQASDGGVLILSGFNTNGASNGTDFDNNGGLIQALAGSEVQLGFLDIFGGTLSTSGDGVIRKLTGQGTRFFDVVFDADFIIDDGNTHVSGIIENRNSILVNGERLLVEDPGVTLDGGGTITFSGNASIERAGGTSQDLTVVDQTIQGEGGFGGGTLNLFIEEEGLIHANVANSTLNVTPNRIGPFGPVEFLENRGTLRASNGSMLEVTDFNSGPTSSPIVNEGTIHAEAGSIVQVTRLGTAGGGGLVNTTTSILKGGGTIAVSDTGTSSLSASGKIEPGDSIGILTLSLPDSNPNSSPNFGTINLDGQLEIEIGGTGAGTGHDQLILINSHNNKTTSIGGILQVRLVSSFVPSNSDEFVILDSPDGYSGTFNDGSSIVCVSGGTFDVNYNSTNITLSNFQTSPIVLGDVNLDCNVNLLDVAPFVDRISNGTFQVEADVNEDGLVNLLDVAPFVELLTGG